MMSPSRVLSMFRPWQHLAEQANRQSRDLKYCLIALTGLVFHHPAAIGIMNAVLDA